MNGRARRVGMAAASGAAATLAAFFNPFLAGMPPIILPYVPLDVRFLALPVLFASLQAMAPYMGWPARGVATLGPATLVAIGNHFHTSTLFFVGGAPWALPGASVHLPGLAGTTLSLLLALAVTFEVGRERFAERALERGLPETQVDLARTAADRLARRSIVTVAGALVVLGLGLRLLGRLVQGTALPLYEVGALALSLAVGAVYIGLQERSSPEAE